MVLFYLSPLPPLFSIRRKHFACGRISLKRRVKKTIWIEIISLIDFLQFKEKRSKTEVVTQIEFYFFDAAVETLEQ